MWSRVSNFNIKLFSFCLSLLDKENTQNRLDYKTFSNLNDRNNFYYKLVKTLFDF